MITYVDTYVSGPDKDALELFAAGFTAYIPAEQGQEAQTLTDSDTGTRNIPAIGDVSKFYTCIRSTFDVTPFLTSPMAAVDVATGKALVGVFA